MRNTVNFFLNPEAHLAQLQKSFGDPFPLEFPGIPRVWLTGQESLARLVFQAPLNTFRPSENNPVGPLLGERGLIMQKGPEHVTLRKEFYPFFMKRSLTEFESVITEIFYEHIRDFPSRGELVLQDFCQELSLKIILRFIFPHLNQAEVVEARELTLGLLNSYSPLYLTLPAWMMKFAPYQGKKLELDERFYTFYCSGFDRGAQGIFYQQQRVLGQKEVEDHLRTFLIAGHETSATALAWCLVLSLQNPDVESDTESLILESMRLHPPVPFVTRMLEREFQLGPVNLEAGEELGVCLSLLHREVQVWEEPDKFKPSRFLQSRSSPYTFAPFGGGSRRCIGAELAMLELKILVELTKKNLRPKIDSNYKPISRPLQITIGPKSKILVSFEKL